VGEIIPEPDAIFGTQSGAEFEIIRSLTSSFVKKSKVR